MEGVWRIHYENKYEGDKASISGSFLMDFGEELKVGDKFMARNKVLKVTSIDKENKTVNSERVG